ncbi:non-specific lipid transfer protein GPI-anchored 5-like [Andrographis paniculata]|uniref:non-specific lipid transfer protein GPI-anchored 5-like n=1 Tax=Andrographis paniculata TaxID=175694 RepID=UPI0021E95D37|nr:non-specific lipid transfer protein GPI-anchored 5-like [Andrographis paniculata]
MADHRRASSSSSSSIALVMILAAAVGWSVAAAQSDDCTNVLIGLSPCLNYISGNSSSPSNGCCTQLRTVVGSQPQCLCQVLNGGGSALGLNINQTQAMALPRACNVQTPPVSQCSSAGSPSGSPGSSTPNTNTSPNGDSGSKTTPSGSNSAFSTRMSVASIAVVTIVAFYALA